MEPPLNWRERARQDWQICVSPDGLQGEVRAWLASISCNEYDDLRRFIAFTGYDGQHKFNQLSGGVDAESNKQRSQFLSNWLKKAVGAVVEDVGTSRNRERSATAGHRIISFAPLRAVMEKHKPQSLCARTEAGKPRYSLASYAFADE